MKYPINSLLIGLFLSCSSIAIANTKQNLDSSLQTEKSSHTIEWVDIVKGSVWPKVIEPTLSLGKDFVFDPSLYALPNSFSMMKSEVSCSQILKAGALSKVREMDLSDLCEYGMDEPVTGVSFNEASQFCETLDAVLPTESQWVYAASQVSNAWLSQYGVIGKQDKGGLIRDFAAYKEDTEETIGGPLGLLGLYASVWEITQSAWDKDNQVYVIKGGAFDLANKPWLMHPYLRAAYNKDDVVNQNVGFRCIKH